MAKRMGRGSPIEPRLFYVLFEHPGYAACCQPSAKFIREHGRLAACFLAWRQRPLFLPALQSAGRIRTDRRQPLFLPLAADPDDARRKIEVPIIESDELTHP